MLPGMGPYKVVSISDDDNTAKIIEIDPVDDDATWVVNMSRLRKYIQRPEWMCNKVQETVGETAGITVETDMQNSSISVHKDTFMDVTPNRPLGDFNIHKDDVVHGLLVDAAVGSKWKCSVLHKTRTQGGKMARVVGKDINAWVSVYNLRKCLCESKSTKVITKAESVRIREKGYWKV